MNPVVDLALSDSGELTFVNAAAEAGVAKDAAGYRVRWSSFDNSTRESRQIGETSSATRRMQMPAGVPTATGSYIRLEVSATGGAHPSWDVPVNAYFQRTSAGWKLVGLERLP